MLHATPRGRRIVDPLLATYYSVPVFVFYPLFIVLFGLNSIPKTVIGFLYAVVAMIINTLNGLDRVPSGYWKTAKAYQLTPAASATYIIFPSAGPYLFTGAKLAVVYSFIGVIGSEFILSSGGLGYRISFSYNNFQSDVMYGLILFGSPRGRLHQHGTVRLGARAPRKARWAMNALSAQTGSRRAQVSDLAILVLGLLILWQLLHYLAGEVAMSAPLTR